MLRRMGGARADLPNDFDWVHIAEEVEGVGRAELHQAESFRGLLLLHLLKVASPPPDAHAVAHRLAEIGVFHDDMRRSMSRTIIREIDVTRHWRLAVTQAKAQLELECDSLIAGLPADCPVSIEECAADTLDVLLLLSRIRQSADPSIGVTD